MMMKTLKSEWLVFAKHCVPPGASDQQIIDMQNIFYSGAAAFIETWIDKKEFTSSSLQDRFQILYDELDEIIKTTSRSDSN
jgi:hypothetical protein